MLARQRIPFDLLVKVRPRHLHRPRSLGDVPVELPQLVEQKRALRGVLEFLEGATLGQRSETGVVEGALSGQTIDVARRDLGVGRKYQQPLDRVSQLANVARPVE